MCFFVACRIFISLIHKSTTIKSLALAGKLVYFIRRLINSFFFLVEALKRKPSRREELMVEAIEANVLARSMSRYNKNRVIRIDHDSRTATGSTTSRW